MDTLTLKWGTLKGYDFSDNSNPIIEKLLKEYHEIGACMSVALQYDTPRQKEIICELIDIGNFDTVYLSWDGKHVSKKKAKEYVMNYSKENK